jgi:hypothetical protein
MAAARVKIFGERNTGTNALSQIVQLNSDSVCLPSTEGDLNPVVSRIANSRYVQGAAREVLIDWTYGDRPTLHSWKHCATNFADVSPFEGVLVLFTIRHPASWLVSSFKRPYHIGRPPNDLSRFIDRPWRTVRRERLGRASYRPLDLYRAKLNSYREFASRLSVRGILHQFVRFEDMILAQETVYRALAPYLMNARPDFVELRASTKDPGKTLDDYRAYYGNEGWRAALDGCEEQINAQLDWDDLKEFGYEPL